MSDEELPEPALPETAAASAQAPTGRHAAQHEGVTPAARWAWATEHGAPEWASTEQLVAWLGREELPPHTLVWKQGWGEWLPAMQVAELAAAFPRVTAGSRRVARAAPGSAATPPAVPIAHYPRLRLLAKDVLSESPLPPASASYQHVAVQAERRAFRDPDHVQQDVVTSQVPAAAMLQAARAMQQSGAPPTRSSAQRWKGLDLGAFGDPPPAVWPSTALPPPRTHASPRPSSTMGYSRWLVRGTLVGGTLGLLSVSWPELAGLVARAGSSLSVPIVAVEASPESLRAIDTRALRLSPLADDECIAPVDTAGTASSFERPIDDQTLLSSASALSPPPPRVPPTRPRRPRSPPVTSRP